MDRRIGTADNYVLEDEAREQAERARVIESGRTYERTPEVLRWLSDLERWRRGGMVWDVPVAPDLSRGERDIHSGATRAVDLTREDLRGADLGDQSPGLARALAPSRATTYLNPGWSRLGTILPGGEEPCLGEWDVAHAMLVAVVRTLALPQVAGNPVRRGPRYDAILDEVQDTLQACAVQLVRILSRADIPAALAEQYQGEESER